MSFTNGDAFSNPIEEWCVGTIAEIHQLRAERPASARIQTVLPLIEHYTIAVASIKGLSKWSRDLTRLRDNTSVFGLVLA